MSEERNFDGFKKEELEEAGLSFSKRRRVHIVARRGNHNIVARFLKMGVERDGEKKKIIEVKIEVYSTIIKEERDKRPPLWVLKPLEYPYEIGLKAAADDVRGKLSQMNFRPGVDILFMIRDHAIHFRYEGNSYLRNIDLEDKPLKSATFRVFYLDEGRSGLTIKNRLITVLPIGRIYDAKTQEEIELSELVPERIEEDLTDEFLSELSNVIMKSGDIHNAIITAIQTIAERHGYRPHSVASHLANVISVVREGPFFYKSRPNFRLVLRKEAFERDSLTGEAIRRIVTLDDSYYDLLSDKVKEKIKLDFMFEKIETAGFPPAGKRETRSMVRKTLSIDPNKLSEHRLKVAVNFLINYALTIRPDDLIFDKIVEWIIKAPSFDVEKIDVVAKPSSLYNLLISLPMERAWTLSRKTPESILGMCYGIAVELGTTKYLLSKIDPKSRTVAIGKWIELIDAVRQTEEKEGKKRKKKAV